MPIESSMLDFLDQASLYTMYKPMPGEDRET